MTHTPIRVVVVAHGPPLKGGIATVALDLPNTQRRVRDGVLEHCTKR